MANMVMLAIKIKRMCLHLNTLKKKYEIIKHYKIEVEVIGMQSNYIDDN